MLNKEKIGWFVVLMVAMALSITIGTIILLPRAEEPEQRAYDDFLWLREETITLTATGAAGAATATDDTDRRVAGYVYAVHVDYTAGISDTTDITLTQDSPSLTVLALTDTNTDGWYYPTVAVHDTSGNTRQWYETILTSDHIDIEAGDTTSGTVATVTIYWGE